MQKMLCFLLLSIVMSSPIVAQTKIEAENSTYTNCAVKTSTSASNGSYIDCEQGCTIKYAYSAPSASSYSLIFRGNVSVASTRSFGIYINSSKVGVITYSSTTWTDASVTANLNSGSNIIELRDSEGTIEPNQDYISIIGNSTNYTLTTNTSGSGTITLNPTGGSYTSGTVVTISASPASDYLFSVWSGSLTGNTNPTTITMNGNKSVTATFTTSIPTYTLTTSTTGSGSISLSPAGGTYTQGTVVTLSATPASGYQFSGWSGALSGTTNPATITMNGNNSVAAGFTVSSISASKWYSGAGVPASSLGNNNDCYLNTSNADVYAKLSGTWSLTTNIRGLQGSQGPTGATGTQGSQGLQGPQGPAGAGVNIMKIATLNWYSINTAYSTIVTGSSPGALCFDGGYIWVANVNSNDVSKILAYSGQVVGTYACENTPLGIANGGDYVFVTNYNSNTVTRLNASDGSNAGTLTVGVNPYGIAFDGTYIWVANQSSNTVTKVQAGVFSESETFPVGNSPRGMAFDGENIWVVNSGSNSVSKLNMYTGATLGTYPTGSIPMRVAFDGTNVWVTNLGSNSVTKLLASTGAMVGEYTLRGSDPLGIAFDGKYIWVTMMSSNNLIKLNPENGQEVAMHGGNLSHPFAIAFDGYKLWVANFESNFVSRF